MFAYRDSTAMITGASKGLGAAFAKELAGRRMNLVLVARSIDTLQDLDEFLRGCINQDEGRCVRQRRAGGPPYLAIVRSEKVRRLSWTFQRARRHLASSSAAPQRHG
jgi:NAD(P)-dependent dehydrogenase (short-subunit alcohol dehydrogenase family)